MGVGQTRNQGRPPSLPIAIYRFQHEFLEADDNKSILNEAFAFIEACSGENSVDTTDESSALDDVPLLDDLLDLPDVPAASDQHTAPEIPQKGDDTPSKPLKKASSEKCRDLVDWTSATETCRAGEFT
ncbi:hypothetical protein PRIC2_012000 [Phytophthora ramorum]